MEGDCYSRTHIWFCQLLYSKEGVLLSGDTLFYESYGRTDLATGSSSDITDSLLNKLFVLPEDTMVYPGHGDTNYHCYEKEHNPIPYYR